MTSLTPLGILICLVIVFVSIGIEVLTQMRVKTYEYIESCLENCSYESSFWYTHGNYVDCVQGLESAMKECIYSRLDEACESFPECGCCNITLMGGGEKK